MKESLLSRPRRKPSSATMPSQSYLACTSLCTKPVYYEQYLETDIQYAGFLDSMYCNVSAFQVPTASKRLNSACCGRKRHMRILITTTAIHDTPIGSLLFILCGLNLDQVINPEDGDGCFCGKLQAEPIIQLRYAFSHEISMQYSDSALKPQCKLYCLDLLIIPVISG